MKRFKPPSPVAVGTLVRVVGLTLEARGLQAPLGALCRVSSDDGAAVDAEVVGFNDGVLYLMPFTEPVGIGPGARVALIARIPSAALGPALLGRVIDGQGQPLDGGPQPLCADRLGLRGLPLIPWREARSTHRSTSECERSTACSRSGAGNAWASSPALASGRAC